MYLSYYQLHHNPFQISTDPRFLWLGEKHEEGLATLKYGVQENKGFLLLTGDVGTGKTTLVNALLKSLGEDTLVATIRDPKLDPLDFYNYLAHAFHMESEFRRKGTFLIHFERLLHQAYDAGRKVVLIIDEAQRITQQLLEEVRLLSNIERQDSKLLNIFFIGQIEFNEILLRHENRAIRQRITVNYTIPPLTEKEIIRYIRHRLHVAAATDMISAISPLAEKIGDGQKQELPGPSLDNLFSAEAVREIFYFSKGYPRLINIICDRCLLTGYVEEARTITAGIVKECIEELTIPKMSRPPSVKTQPVPSRNVPAGKKNQKKNGIMLPRLIFLAAAFFILLAAGYFSRTPDGLVALQNIPTKEYARKLQQLAQELTDPETLRQEQTLPLSVSGRPAAETTAAEDKDANPEAVRQQEKLKDAHATATLTEEEKIHLPPDERAAAPDDSQPEDNRVSETPEAAAYAQIEQTAPVRDIQMKPLISIDKLIIPFPTDSNFPPPDSLEQLNRLIETLLLRPQFTLLISGYTDSLGYESYNEKLAEFRANSIKSYLVGRGISESKIIARSFGSKNPLAPNDTESGRKANRRVEIEIIP